MKKIRIFPRKGFTLIELLVVIGIIGLLISLLLPAVQAAREAGRRLECSNKIRQLSMAVLNHESATKRFPSGGWGWRWIGDPDEGNSTKQPGGWAYNILPFIEQTTLHNLGAGLTGTSRDNAIVQMMQTLMPDFICPSRSRPLELYPYHPNYHPQTFNAPDVEKVARTDYAINRGDYYVDGKEGPSDYEAKNYTWPDTTLITGISYVHSQIRVMDITDGLSNTYLIGEKYMNPQDYTSGADIGDDSSLCQGDDFDIARYTYLEYEKDGKPIKEPLTPLKDSRTITDYFTFGSAHPTTWQVSFCDGSVHSISYDIDAELHRRLGNRHDGELVDKSQL